MCDSCCSFTLSALQVYTTVEVNGSASFSSFWDMALCCFKNDVPCKIEKDTYCFEFSDDDLLDAVPHYHGDRLMKDEYIDGEISRDISRTFPHHFLFRHKENGCLDLLESVLRKVSDNYFRLGYCQGMNYVVGAILVAILDPECNGYYSDNDIDELQQRVRKCVRTLPSDS